MKKLLISLLVFISMGFAVANDYKTISKSIPAPEVKAAPAYGYLEVSSPSANSITLSGGN